MARSKQGAFGQFGGMLGNVVGAAYNGQAVMRIRPAQVRNPNSPAQARQRQAFALITGFCHLAKGMIDEGYTRTSRTQSCVNLAVRDNLRSGLSGEYPDQELYYPGLSVASGSLDGARGETIELTGNGTLQVRWIDNSGRGKAKATDVTLLMVFNPEQKEAMVFVGEAARSAAMQEVELPLDYNGQELHVWLAFRRADDSMRSNSTYAGSVIPG